MDIKLNKSYSGWLDISENKNKSLEIKVSHLSREQYYKLEQIMLSCNDLPSVVDQEKKTVRFDFENMTADQKAKALTSNRMYMEYFLKYTIKDWKGFLSEGKDIKLQIVNNEMSDSYWEGFMTKLEYNQLETVFKMVEQEVSFGDTELKK